MTASQPKHSGEQKLMLLVALAIILILSGLASCKPHRLMAKFDRLADKCYRKGQDTVPPKWCLTHYASEDRVVPGKIIYKPGKVIEKIVPGRTIVVDCDSVLRSKPATAKVRVPTPAAIHDLRIDTVVRHDTIYRTDGYKLAIATSKLSMEQTAHNKTKGKYTLARNTCITLGGLCALLLALLVGGLTGRLSHPSTWFK